jgi:hypothetical protein
MVIESTLEGPQSPRRPSLVLQRWFGRDIQLGRVPKYWKDFGKVLLFIRIEMVAKAMEI